MSNARRVPDQDNSSSHPDGQKAHETIVGEVMWFNSVKGFGVIEGENGEEYFVHKSQIPSDLLPLKKGARVEFSWRYRPPKKGGKEAYNVMNAVSVTSPTVTAKEISSPVIQKEEIKKKADEYWYSSYSRNATSIIVDDTPKSAIPNVIHTKVVGVTYEGRQAVVAKMSIGEKIVLRREPYNAYDCNAIRAERINGQQFGYIPRELASSLADKFDAVGGVVIGHITNLVGGYTTDSSLGVRVEFTLSDEDDSEGIDEEDDDDLIFDSDAYM